MGANHKGKGIAVITKLEDFDLAAKQLWGATLEELRTQMWHWSLYEPVLFKPERLHKVSRKAA
jgi:hypothetical protein